MLPCGHYEGCLYRYRYKGKTKKYCMSCIVEKHPDAEVTPARYQEQIEKQKANQQKTKEQQTTESKKQEPKKVVKVEKKTNSSNNKPK